MGSRTHSLRLFLSQYCIFNNLTNQNAQIDHTLPHLILLICKITYRKVPIVATLVSFCSLLSGCHYYRWVINFGDQKPTSTSMVHQTNGLGNVEELNSSLTQGRKAKLNAFGPWQTNAFYSAVYRSFSLYKLNEMFLLLIRTLYHLW